MVEGHPDTETQVPEQGKLILPAVPDEAHNTPGSQPHVQVHSGQLIRQSSTLPPGQPFARLGYLWRRDPAYKVLFIAIAMVVVAGIVFVSLASAAFFNPNFFSQGSISSQNSTPGSAVDLQPTFAAPGGGKGSTESSQPPVHNTPVLQVTNVVPTPTSQPSPNPTPTSGPGSGGGTLSVQITSIPGQVVNNSVVAVSVNTSEPNVTVRLQVSYNTYPFFYQSKARVTDGDGNAMLNWAVSVARRGFGKVVARVVVIATDQNGQQAVSSTTTVQVITFGPFGGGGF